MFHASFCKSEIHISEGRNLFHGLQSIDKGDYLVLLATSSESEHFLQGHIPIHIHQGFELNGTYRHMICLYWRWCAKHREKFNVYSVRLIFQFSRSQLWEFTDWTHAFA